MRRGVAALLPLLALAAAGCGGGTTTVTVATTVTTTRTVTTTATSTNASSACAASALSGSFDVIPGSAGAGQIAYSLKLTNTSQSSCFVSGLPQVELLDSGGTVLPTHVSAEQPGQSTAAQVDLAPGASAHADARFSPDVPGPGEQQTGPCEPAAARLRVAPLGGGTLDVPVHPLTSVCEHGSLQFRAFVSGS